MKKMPPPILIFIAFFFCMASVAGQSPDIINGRYISAEGDSVSGQMYLGSIKDNVLKIKTPSGKNWRKLTPKDVKEARCENGLSITTHLVVFNNDTTLIFIQKILDGGYSLYEGSSKNHGDVFFINSRDRQNLIRVNPRGLQPQMKVYFGKCAEKTTTRLRYKKESLMQFVALMNQCSYPNKQQFRYEQPLKPRLSVGISAGYAFHSEPKLYHSYHTFKWANFSKATRPVLGLTGNLNITPMFGISTGIYYVDKSIVSDSLDVGEPKTYIIANPDNGQPYPVNTIYYYRFIFDAKLKYIEIPLAFRLHLSPFAKSAPLVFAGLNFSFPLTTKFVKSWGDPYRFSPHPLLIPPPTLNDGKTSIYKTVVDKPIIGVHGGVGWRWGLSRKSELEVALSYHWSREKVKAHLSGFYDGVISFELDRQRLQITANYYFFLGKKRQ